MIPLRVNLWNEWRVTDILGLSLTIKLLNKNCELFYKTGHQHLFCLQKLSSVNIDQPLLTLL